VASLAVMLAPTTRALPTRRPPTCVLVPAMLPLQVLALALLVILLVVVLLLLPPPALLRICLPQLLQLRLPRPFPRALLLQRVQVPRRLPEAALARHAACLQQVLLGCHCVVTPRRATRQRPVREGPMLRARPLHGPPIVRTPVVVVPLLLLLLLLLPARRRPGAPRWDVVQPDGGVEGELVPPARRVHRRGGHERTRGRTVLEEERGQAGCVRQHLLRAKSVCRRLLLRVAEAAQHGALLLVARRVRNRVDDRLLIGVAARKVRGAVRHRIRVKHAVLARLHWRALGVDRVSLVILAGRVRCSLPCFSRE